MSLDLQELDERIATKFEDDEKFNKTVSIAVNTLVAGILQHSPVFNKYYHKVSMNCDD